MNSLFNKAQDLIESSVFIKIFPQTHSTFTGITTQKYKNTNRQTISDRFNFIVNRVDKEWRNIRFQFIFRSITLNRIFSNIFRSQSENRIRNNGYF
jgi:hypothetical protein